VVIALVSFVLLDAVLGSSRGMLYSTSSTVLVSLCVARRLRPSVTVALGMMAAVGLVILLLLGFRNFLYLGEWQTETPTASEALISTLTTDATHRARRISGTEFVYHALLIDTVDQTGKYHLGLEWAYKVTVHPIPRLLWPDKPYGFQSGGVTWADIEEHTGVRIAAGSAPGIVADLYSQFGKYFVLFFYVFGWLARRLMDRAQTLASPLAGVAYVMLHALSLNTFAQGFGALIVPFLYSLAPIVGYTLVIRIKARPSGQETKTVRTASVSRPGWSGLPGRRYDF
jgi:hypothetical protein